MNAHRKPFESLEQRRLLAATIKSTDVRTISDTDGTKENGNDIVVKLSEAAQGSPDISKMRMFGYANNTLLGGQSKTTINIVSATVTDGNLVLRTDVQVRKGAQLTLQTGALTNIESNQTIKTKKGLNRDRFTLALRAFSPADKTFFSNERLVGGSTPTTANTAASESAVLAQLTAFLNRKVNNEKTISAAQRDAALANFNSSANKAIVPAHNLRAAIASLVGTIGEPAINFYFGTANSTGKTPLLVTFDGTQISSGATICEGSYTSSDRYKLIWNPNYAGEHFAVLSGRLVHEAMHDSVDRTNSQDEEVVLNFVESVVYAQQAVTDFTITRGGTLYSTYANYRLMLTLNSGDRQFPRVGIKEAPIKGGVANPGFVFTSPYEGTGMNSLDADVRAEFEARNVADKPPTAVNDASRQILTNLTGNTYTSETGKFGDSLINDIDIAQDTLGDAFAMRAARVLQLTI